MDRIFIATFRDLFAAVHDVFVVMGTVIECLAGWIGRHRWALWALAAVYVGVLAVCVIIEPMTIVYVSVTATWACVLAAWRW